MRCRLKYPYICFSSRFCFLVTFILLMFVLSVLFLVAVFSLLLYFLCCLLVIALMHRHSLKLAGLPSFLNTYRVFMSSLGCKALCIVMSFLVLWSICWSSSLVHFKNGFEYITSGTAQVFIHLMRFLQDSLVSRSFLVLLRYFKKKFSFISDCLMASASNIPKYL